MPPFFRAYLLMKTLGEKRALILAGIFLFTILIGPKITPKIVKKIISWRNKKNEKRIFL